MRALLTLASHSPSLADRNLKQPLEQDSSRGEQDSSLEQDRSSKLHAHAVSYPPHASSSGAHFLQGSSAAAENASENASESASGEDSAWSGCLQLGQGAVSLVRDSAWSWKSVVGMTKEHTVVPLECVIL